MIQDLREQLKLDIATTVPDDDGGKGESQVVALMQGVLDEDIEFTKIMRSEFDKGQIDMSAALQRKFLREMCFPSALLKSGFDIDIKQAQASREDDKIRILNTINGVDAAKLSDVQPDLNNPALDRVNYSLKSFFAEAAATSSQNLQELTKCMNTLAMDKERTMVNLFFHGHQALEDCGLIGAALKQFKALRTLNLTFGECEFLVDIGALGESLESMTHLENLSLGITVCPGISFNPLASGFAGLRSLKMLDLNLKDWGRQYDGPTPDWASAEALAGALKELTTLKQFTFNYQNPSSKLVAALGESLLHMPLLQYLSLDLEGAYSVGDEAVAPIGTALGRMSELQTLAIAMQFADTICDVPTIVEGLKSQKNMKRLSLNFSRCESLSCEVTTEIGRAVGQISSLEELTIGLVDNNCNKDPKRRQGVPSGFGGLQNLRLLDLSFAGHQQIDDLSELTQALQQLPRLQELFLDFGDCRHVNPTLKELSDVVDNLETRGTTVNLTRPFSGTHSFEQFLSSYDFSCEDELDRMDEQDPWADCDGCPYCNN